MDWCDENGVGLHLRLRRQQRARRAGGRDRRSICASIMRCRSSRNCALYKALEYKAGSWRRPRKRDRADRGSMHPDPTPADPNGMRQEIDIRYVVTSLEGSARASLRRRLLPARADGEPDQAAQGAAGVGSHVVSFARPPIRCGSTLHTAAFWLMHRRARRDPARPCARQGRVRHHPAAPDQDRRARDRAWPPHPRAAADELCRESACSAPSHSACRRPG